MMIAPPVGQSRTLCALCLAYVRRPGVPMAVAPLPIDTMTYKELQHACKTLGLGGRGKADDLRSRLLAAGRNGVQEEVHALRDAHEASLSPPELSPTPPPLPPLPSPEPSPPPVEHNGVQSEAPVQQAPVRQAQPKARMVRFDESGDRGLRYDARGALIEEPAAPATDEPKTASGCDMELTILGSGACSPSPWRGASCSALRVRDSYWLFDVGEGTQIQLQKAAVRASRIDRIFITHAHGDHCFGLPGLLCLIGQGRSPSAPPVQIYGPPGLRAFVKITLAFTGTRMLPPYSIHELHDIPDLRRPDRVAKQNLGAVPPPSHDNSGRNWGEVGGTDTPPASDGSWWTLFHEDGVKVCAAPLTHTVPTVGFIVTEDDKPGRLLVDKVMPHINRNSEEIRQHFGLRDPRALLKRITALAPHEEIALPDGTVLRGSEVLGEARTGRKIVLLGDCSDARLAESLGQGADLLVHEATNAYLPQFGDKGGAAALERETARHGHSTPQMAGRLARNIGAKALLLTHFSQRYHPANRNVMGAISRLAVKESKLSSECVKSAYDSLTLPLWQRDREKPPLPLEASAEAE